MAENPDQTPATVAPEDHAPDGHRHEDGSFDGHDHMPDGRKYYAPADGVRRRRPDLGHSH